jgi:hypothetical protein
MAGERGSTGRIRSTGWAGRGTGGRAVIASVSLGFTGVGGIVGPSGIEPSVIPPSGSTGTAGDRARGGSGVTCSTMGGGAGGGATGAVGGAMGVGGGATGAAAGAGGGATRAGGGATGAVGGAAVAIAGFGGSEGAVGGRRSGARFGAAGVSTRDGATGLGCAAGAGGAGRGGAASLTRLGNPGAGKTSRALMPGGTVASQAMRPSTTTWAASEPDMQMPRVTAGEPFSVVTGKDSGCSGEPEAGLGRAGQDGGEAGSLMSPLLPRVAAFAYGLLRVSESPPAGLRVYPRSGETARAGLEAGTPRSTNEPGDEAGEVPMAAGDAARSTPAFRSGLAVGGDSGTMGDPEASGSISTGMIPSAGRGSPNPAPAPPPTTSAQARTDARRRPVTEPV